MIPSKSYEMEASEMYTTSVVFHRRLHNDVINAVLRFSTIFFILMGIVGCQSGKQLVEKVPEKEKEGQIAFVSEVDGDFDIYTMVIDGSEKIKLTNTRQRISFRPGHRMGSYSHSYPFVMVLAGLNGPAVVQTIIAKSM